MSTRRAPDVPAAAVIARSAKEARSLRQQAPAAYTPGDEFRKERKVLDSGARVEVKLEKLLNSRRLNSDGMTVVAWRRPGVRARRLSGVDYYPDAAGYIPELARILPARKADIAGRPAYNALFEFKGQQTTGSAEKKITTAIIDLAHTCDVTGTVGAIILDTPRHILTDRQILDFKVTGKIHSVVVLTTKEVQSGALVPALVKVAKERRRLARRISARGFYTPTKRPPVYERGLAMRITQRRLMRLELGRHAKVPLVR